MKGHTFKRCACGTVRDADGKRVNCPKKHGSWTYIHELPPAPDGKRRQKAQGGFATEKDARKAMQESLQQVRRGVRVETAKLTVSEYLDQWLAGKANLAPATRRSYGDHIALYLKPGLGHLRLTDLRDIDIERLYRAVAQLGRDGSEASPSTLTRRLADARANPRHIRPMGEASRRRVHATLMSALNSAVRRKYIPFNPAQYVEVPTGRRPRAVVWTPERVAHWRRTGQRPPVAVWTPEQVGAFLDAAQSDRLYPLFHLIAHRGLRRGEAIGLLWRDVNLDEAQIRITQQIVMVGWTTEIRAPKTESGDRSVPLDAGTVEVLCDWRGRQADERRAWGAAWSNTGLVFTHEDGTALRPDQASDAFARLVQAADLPPIRLHDLRHTAASLALRAGVPMKVVSEQLGHSNLAITADTYTSVLPEVSQAAAEAVAGIVPRGAAGAPAANKRPR